MTNRQPLLLIVSSPSGAGKTTLCKKLLTEFKNIRFSISHTTRPPRKGETHGKDYFFCDTDSFDEMIHNDHFVEWAQVHGNRYGTSHLEIQCAAEENTDLVFDVDYQGARQIKTQYPNAIGIFILPPSLEELHRRLSARGTETAETLGRRYKAALMEIAQYTDFDYLLVNDDAQAAYDKMRAIVLAEHCREHRNKHIAQNLLD